MLKSQVICDEQIGHPGRQRALCLDLCTDLCIQSQFYRPLRDDGFLQMNHCVQMAKSFCRYCQKQKKGKYLKIKPLKWPLLKCLAFLSNVHFWGCSVNFNKKLKGFTQGLGSYQLSVFEQKTIVQSHLVSYISFLMIYNGIIVSVFFFYCSTSSKDNSLIAYWTQCSLKSIQCYVGKKKKSLKIHTRKH